MADFNLFDPFGLGGTVSTGDFMDGAPVSTGGSLPNTAGALVPQSSVMADVSNVFNLGMSGVRTFMGYNLASQQISLGQPVTVLGQNGQMSGTANVSTTANLARGLISPTVWLLLGLVMLFVLFKK